MKRRRRESGLRTRKGGRMMDKRIS